MTSVHLPTRTLLGGAALGAPVFVVVSLGQAFTRPGFDLIRHPLSLLSNGDLGWLQITNFVVTGVLTLVGAVGLGRVLGGTVSWLLAVGGAGTVASGLFRLDPMDGFPVGTPAGQPSGMSWHSYLHLAFGTISFVTLIAACLVLGRYFRRQGRNGYAVASRLSGVAFAGGLLWAVAGGRAGSLTLAMGSSIAMLWLSLVYLRVRADLFEPANVEPADATNAGPAST
jgi:hypothetical protein